MSTNNTLLSYDESANDGSHSNRAVYAIFGFLTMVAIIVSIILWKFRILFCIQNSRSKTSMMGKVGEDNLGYGTLETFSLNRQNSECILQDFPMDKLASDSIKKPPTSASQHSLNTFVSNRNISKVFMTSQQNITINYSISFKEALDVIDLNIVSLENMQSIEASDLNIVDKLNVYIKIELVFIDKNGVLIRRSAKTRMVRNRTNPIFDESFEFCDFVSQEEDANESKGTGIFFYICNLNTFGRDQLLGELVQKLSKKDLVNEEHPNLHRVFSKHVNILDPKVYEEASLGQLEISLLFKKASNSIIINVTRAIALRMPKIYLNSGKLPNSFVKIYLLHKGRCIDKKVTKVVANNADPIFNESFELKLDELIQMLKINIEIKSYPDLVQKILSKLEIFFLVMDEDQLNKNDAIGKIELNDRGFANDFAWEQNELNTNGFASSSSLLWFDIFLQPNKPLEFIYDIKHF